MIWKSVAVALLALAWAGPVEAKRNPWVNPTREKVPGVSHHTYNSTAMNVPVGYNIYLPPQYTTGQERFPVIYYLHGLNGDESSYLDYARLLQADITAGRVPPMIIVFANGGPDSFFSDSPDGEVMAETTVLKELVPHIDATYRTLASSSGRSVHGYSMGAFGALKFAMKYPETFGSAVAYGAALPDAREMEDKLKRTYNRMFGGSARRFEENNPFSLAEKAAARIRGKVQILITLGSKDDLLELNERLHKRLTVLEVPHSYEVISGVRRGKDTLYEKTASRAFRFTADAIARRST